MLFFLSNISYAQNLVLDNIVNDDNSSIYDNMIYNLNKDKFLGHPQFSVTAIVPSDIAFKKYIDPVSYATEKKKIWEFYMDASKAQSRQICANVYDAILTENGYVKDEEVDKPITITGGTDNAIIKNRLDDLFLNSTIIENLSATKHFYKTMGNSYVHVDCNNGSYNVYGSLQEKYNKPIAAKNTNADNGNVLFVDEPVLTTYESVAQVLEQNKDFSEFLSLLKACNAISTKNISDNWQAGDQVLGNLINIKNAGSLGAENITSEKKVTYLLNNYNYTLYVPNNNAMQKAYEAGLPKIKDIEIALQKDDDLDIYYAYDPNSEAAKLMEIILNFVKYHIQDNSIFVDEGFESKSYYTAKFKHLISQEDASKYIIGKPYKLDVNVSSTALSITDASGNVANVIKQPGYYNLMATEYWFSSANRITKPHTVQINNSSFVVIQGIDAPLFYDKQNQFTYKYYPLISD